MRNILIIKLRYIGDVLLCTPLVRSLRENYPKARIVFLVNPGTDEILRHHPCLDEVLILPRSGVFSQLRFFQEIRSRKFDCVLDLTDGDRSAAITALTGAPLRIGYNNENRWRGMAYSHCIEAKYGSMHMIEYHGQVALQLGIQNAVGPPEVFLSKHAEEAAQHLLEEEELNHRPWVMVHPSARYWFKAWPAERFAALSDWLAKQGIAVVLVGSENDIKVAEDIQYLAASNPVSLMGKTSVLELASLMKHCLLFIGNDGGPMHIAAAMGCQVLALFGPSDPAVWGPRGERLQVLYKGLDCRACFHPDCFRGEERCMKQISIDEVCAAILPMLSNKQVLSH